MFETNRWTPLSDEQRDFFRKQVDAGLDAAFSPAAHQAGIVAMHAQRFNFNKDVLTKGYGIVWPDATSPGDHCALVGVRQSGAPKMFARIVEEPASIAIEGVALDCGIGASAMHAQQIVQRHEASDVFETLPSTALSFLSDAMQKAKNTQNMQTFLPSTTASTIEVAGVDGTTVGRLYQSLTSLYDNLILPTAPERGQLLPRSTYDMAQALWKVSVRHAMETQDPSSIVLHDERGVHGAFFETESGLSIVRRILSPNDAFAIGSIKRPGAGETHLFAEQHTVSAFAVHADSTLLPAEMYVDPKMIISALPAFDMDPRSEGESRDIRVELDDPEIHVMQQKLAALLTDRINATV